MQQYHMTRNIMTLASAKHQGSQQDKRDRAAIRLANVPSNPVNRHS